MYLVELCDDLSFVRLYDDARGNVEHTIRARLPHNKVLGRVPTISTKDLLFFGIAWQEKFMMIIHNAQPLYFINDTHF